MVITDEKSIKLITSQDFHNLDFEIENTIEYKELFDNNGIRMFVKTKGEGTNHPSGISRYKYFGTLNFDIDVVYSVFREDSLRNTWDTRDMGRKVLKIFSHHVEGDPVNSVIWTTKKGQFLVASRDFVSLQASTREVDAKGESVAYRLISRALDDYYEEQPNFTRARLIFLGMKLWKDPETGNTRYVCITQADPCGWISSYVVNWVVKFVPHEFEKGVINGCNYRIENGIDNEKWKNAEF